MNSNDSRHDRSEAYYPIRHVTGVTGVNPVTLRAWERRYGLVSPKRTESGHRLYSQRDVERIARAVQMIDTGMSISEACDAIARSAETRRTPQAAGIWAGLSRRIQASVARYDEADLENLLGTVLRRYPMHTVFAQLLAPAIAAVFGSDGAGSRSAEGAFLSTYLRNKLGARFHHRATRRDGPALVVGSLPGLTSELGALTFACAAHEAGMRPTVIGAGSDVSSLAGPAGRLQARGIVIAAHDPAEVGEQSAAIERLAHGVDIPVFLFGAGTTGSQRSVRAAGAVPLDGNFSADMLTVRQALDSAAPIFGMHGYAGGRQ